MKNNKRLFYKNLIEFMMHFKHKLYQVAVDNDLSAMQLVLVMSLGVNQSESMNYFKRLFNCDASNITNIAEALVRKKIISRSESPDDRRIKELKLLPKGEKLQQKILDELGEENAQVFLDMDKNQIIDLTNYLQNWI